VKQIALARGLTVIQPDTVRTAAFLETVRSSHPEVLVVVAYGRILPGPVLRAATRGAVNVHFSLLPRYRGAAPVHWALARGERVTGVTTMAMNERMDEGDILLQVEVPIERLEHSPALQDRLAGVGASLLVETLSRLEAEQLHHRVQEAALATYAPLLRRQDGEGDLTLPAREVEGRVRGFDPWPGVWMRIRTRRLRLVRAEASSEIAHGELPGRVLEFRNGAFRIACGGGTLLDLFALQPAGGKVLTAKEAFNGRIVRPGDLLETTED